ncbi:MAG: lanthionine synthetase C family protein, partial [Thermosynechococcaceae cyanobacterium]
MLKLQNSSWSLHLKPDLAAIAATVAHKVVACMRLRSQIEAAVTAAAQQTTFPKSIYWLPYSVAQGDAGLAIMSAYLDSCFPEESWDITGHHYLQEAARAAEAQVGIQIGLFSGLSGLAFAAWSLSRSGTRYNKLLTQIEEILLPQTMDQASSLSRYKGLSVHQFDLISGITGVGAYLLSRRDQVGTSAALRAILSSLVELSQAEAGLPRWHTPAHLISDETMQRFYPNGNLNCGLAHGIPGPLALMALAQSCGVEVAGLSEAIERLARWLSQNHLEDPWGVNWPTAIPLPLACVSKVPADRQERSENLSGPSDMMTSSRAAWC